MARMAAGVRKRSDGTLEKRFTLNGKRYSVYGKTTKEIQAKEQEIRKNAENGLCVEKGRITLDQYFEEWKATKQNHIKSSTLLTYMSYYKNYISPAIGKKKIQKIERREISAFQNELLKTVKTGTANVILICLKTILNDAVRDEIIVKSPAAGIKAAQRTEKRAVDTIHRALTPEEQKYFMDAMSNSFYYELTAFLLSTGMRFGEATALTWGDIDNTNNVIHVNKTATRAENGLEIGATKTAAGTRDIPISENMRYIFKRQRAKMGNLIPMQDMLIFLSPRGNMIKNNVYNAAIKSVLKSAGNKEFEIDHFTAHALRDTFATRFIEQGGTPQTLKTILGHSNISITMDLYAHVLPNTKQKEMDAISICI